MSRKAKVLDETAPLLIKEYGEKTASEILKVARGKFESLCAEHQNDNQAIKAQTEGNIYQAIGLYAGLQAVGIQKSEALRFLDWSYSFRAEKAAASMRKIMKIPGLYKLYPRMFRWVARHQFGEKAGFKAKFYDTEKTRVRFDMTQCLFCDVCRREGCEEIVPCFCHTDDVNNGKLHPNLCWNRSKIMGDGAEMCDFDLFVKK